MAKKRRRNIGHHRQNAVAREPLTRNELAWRAGVAVVTAGLIWLGFQQAVVGITRHVNPTIALRVGGSDPVALSMLADARLAQAEPAAIAEAADMARKALSNQIALAPALRVIGLSDEARGHLDQGRRAIRLSERVSRRDRLTQLWLIEDAVRRNDIPGALTHYDTALRTTRALDPLLFPQLGGALDDVEIRTGLVPVLRAKPSWLKDFLFTEIKDGKKPAALAETLIATGPLGDTDDFRALDNSLMVRLADAGEFSTLVRFFASRGGSDRSLLRAVDFSPAQIAPRFQPITWQLPGSPGIDALFQRQGAQRSILSVAVEPGATGIAARKLLFIQPGRYRVLARAQASGADSAGSATWRLRCARGAEEIWSSASRTDIVDVRRETCSPLWFELVVSGGSGTDLVQITAPSPRVEPLS